VAATRVEYRPLALDDLDAIFDYIAQDSPDRALAFVEDIQARCEALAEFPLRGPGRDDLAPGLRILPLPRRVIVAYVCTADSVTIVRLFYGGQDHETILRGANDL
jgi:toxin ParE1/3/4